jgi:hypothetical protein
MLPKPPHAYIVPPLAASAYTVPFAPGFHAVA